LAGDLVAGGQAGFGGFATASFAEAEDGAAVDGEVLFALAGISSSLKYGAGLLCFRANRSSRVMNLLARLCEVCRPL
jgi:hypothetical protein